MSPRLQGLAFLGFTLAAPFMAAWEVIRSLWVPAWDALSKRRSREPAPGPDGALSESERDAWARLVYMYYMPASERHREAG